MKVTISKLRENIYQLLDSVLKTGHPLEIERNGKKLIISSVPSLKKMEKLERRDIINGIPESIISVDWSDAWKPKLK